MKKIFRVSFYFTLSFFPALLLFSVSFPGTAAAARSAEYKGPERSDFKVTKASRVQDSLKISWWNPEEHAFPTIEGQAWPDETGGFYDRLPARAEKMVRDAVWDLSRETAGLLIRFRSNASEIQVRYAVEDPVDMNHMPATGVSGVDLYAISKDGEWEWTAGKYSFKDTISYRFQSLPEDYKREYRLYLPLYNKVKWLEIGVPEGAAMEPLPVRKDKPIVIYGTSIAQGACASRPGLAWTNILGRKLDRPVINLAFSGNGRLEEALCDLLTELDPELFVIDCFPNMWRFPDDTIKARLVKTISSLRKKRPAIPVLIAEDADESINSLNIAREEGFDRLNRLAKEAFVEMKSGGLQHIHFLPADEIGLSVESTVDGVHPNDIGMMEYAEAYEKVIREILNEPQGHLSTTRPCIQYRSGDYYDWQARHREILEINRTDPPAVVFLGNSITHFWGGKPAAPAREGQDSWKKYFAARNVLNAGYGWDRIENVLWRVYHGELDGFNARQVAIMIGTNNLGINTDAEILEGLRLLVQAVKSRQPSAKVLLLGIYPRRDQEERIFHLNQEIAGLAAKENIQYADPGHVFLNTEGKIKEDLFSDGLHPNAAGYRLLGEAIAPSLTETSR